MADRSFAAGPARDAADHIHRSLARLADFPEIGVKVDAYDCDTIVRFGRDGFVVRYRVDRDLLIIVRIFHGRQKR